MDSKFACGRMVLAFFSFSMGMVMVLWKGGPSGIRVPRSHRPLIFSLSATFRKDCSESCVMLT